MRDTVGGSQATREPPPWVEWTVYVGLAFGAILPSLWGPDLVPGDGVDLYGTLWFYWWIADSIGHLHDPSFTDLFFHPDGKDIFAHTGNNFVDAAVAAPLQWVLGNPGYYRWWVVVLMIGNAVSFRWLARSEIGHPWAAFAATALWEINPYTMFELTTGRPTQAFLWFLPLAFLALRRVDRSIAWAVASGILVALVGYSYWFYAYFFCFAAVWVVGGDLVTCKDRGRYLAHLGLAAGVAVVLVAPAVVAMAHRASEGAIPGASDAAWNGLFGLPEAVSNSVSTNLHGYLLTESRGARFYHHPAAAVAALMWLALGRGRLRWAPVALVGLLVATGPAQEVFGTQVPMWHYLPLYNVLPFFDRLWFPYRALVLSFLATSLGAGFLLARLDELLREWGGRWTVPAVLSLLLAGTVATERLDYTWPLVVRDVRMPPSYAWMAEQGGGILDLPRGVTQVSIVHQTRHGLPLFGGMGENAPVFWPRGYEARLADPFMRGLTRATRHPDLEPNQRDLQAKPTMLRAHGFRWIVLHRNLVDSELNRFAHRIPPEAREAMPFRAQERLVAILGAPVAVDGPMVIWALDDVPAPPPALRPTERALTERIWDRPEPAPYEARLHELGRIP